MNYWFKLFYLFFLSNGFILDLAASLFVSQYIFR
jgi:hypothetical protein